MLFLAKMCFFSVEPPIFSRKYHYFEGFGHKETKFVFQNLLFYAHFFEKIFSLASLSIKFTLYIY